jgi:DNA-binding CsgD family transcriptional regulator
MNQRSAPLSYYSGSHLPSLQRGYIGDKPLGYLPSQPTENWATSALDELACGMIIIDQQARVLHHNNAAHAVLARGDSVAIVDGCITTTHAPDQRQFHEALVKASAGKRSMIALGALSCTTVAIVPLRPAHHPNGYAHASEPRFAMMFSRAGVCETLMLSFFSRAHSLTACEETILGLMCAGLTAPEMALQLKVGEATVRTHVRNICAKTHCNGIREVVKRLAVLPPLMAAVMPSAFISDVPAHQF